MKVREPCLPPGWYPRGREEIFRFLEAFPPVFPAKKAVVAPHAGWYYSGEIAAKAICALDRGADTVIVAGGHLDPHSPPLFALEDAAWTPLGEIPLDVELREALLTALGGSEDRRPDNTVEVLLPMIRYFFPGAKLLWVRLPPDMASFEAGRVIAGTAASLGRKAVFAGSTDLTHYGPNYGFVPRGIGEEAARWTREVNDKAFIDAVLARDPSETLRRAVEDCSACSAGAVLGTLGFAEETKASSVELIAGGLSADREKSGPPASFVGYAAIGFA